MPTTIDTRARRKKLPVASHPLWVSIGDARSGLKLGYRKGVRAGVWVGKRIRPAPGSRRRWARLTTAREPA